MIDQQTKNSMYSINTANTDGGNELEINYNFTTRVISNRAVYLMLTEIIFCVMSFYYAVNVKNNFVIKGNLHIADYLVMDGLVRMFLTIFSLYLVYKIRKSHKDLARDCVSWCAILLWIIWETINFFVIASALGVCSNCVSYLYVLLLHSVFFGLGIIVYTYKKRLCCFIYIKQPDQNIKISGTDQNNFSQNPMHVVQHCDQYDDSKYKGNRGFDDDMAAEELQL